MLASDPIDSRDVLKLGRAAGYLDRSLQCTARTLGIEIRREGHGRDHPITWQMLLELYLNYQGELRARCDPCFAHVLDAARPTINQLRGAIVA